MNPEDIEAIRKLVNEAIHNYESFNKVWIASAAVAVSLVSIIVTPTIQIIIARAQRKTQIKLADQQSIQQKLAISEQLSMQELASRRIANANVSAKRQVWIDELRKEIARYLSLWQEISYRWDAIVSKPRNVEISDQELDEFSNGIAEIRKEALEVQLRIELRLNMTEKDHQDLKKIMEYLENTTVLYKRNVSSKPPEYIQYAFMNFRHQLIAKSQKILKDEWERVKKESYADPSEPKPTPA